MNATVQTIFLLGYGLYDQTHRLPSHIREAAPPLMSCRTSVLGGHVQACPDGHFQRAWYNSCKHRVWPLCAFTQVERWLAKQKARILNAEHFHFIFTISDEFGGLWRLNRKVMANLLFKSATETLSHLPCLVTAGGLAASEWIASSKTFLLPFGIVRAVFRGKTFTI